MYQRKHIISNTMIKEIILRQVDASTNSSGDTVFTYQSTNDLTIVFVQEKGTGTIKSEAWVRKTLPTSK